MDTLTKKERSQRMRLVRQKDTSSEMAVRSFLHREVFRYSLQRRDLPGKPDVVLPKYKTVVFVHGCFWHRHERCKRATTPATNTEFWQAKFEANVDRDRSVMDLLRRAGWRVVIIWECEAVPHMSKGAMRHLRGISASVPKSRLQRKTP